VRAKTSEDDRQRLQRQLAGWELVFPRIQAERDRAAAEAYEREEAQRAQAEAEAYAQARQADRNRWQAKQDQQQRENDRARIARLESQLAASRQAAARAAQQQRYEAFWAERMRGLDELIAMASPKPAAQPAVQLVDESYEGSGWLGSPDFNIALLTDPSRW
jgi:Asp-tRNA(Asn)/Glu-tRNA(Gln) amidotransferase A subunit family amidase